MSDVNLNNLYFLVGLILGFIIDEFLNLLFKINKILRTDKK